MSQVKANSFTDASGGSNAVLYGVAAPANSMGFRNRIINGDMRIDQRNAGASFSPGTSGAIEYAVDRFGGCRAGSGVAFSMQQVADAPAGFVNSLKVTVPTGTTPTGTQLSFMSQPIEGQNVADFGWGSANAQAATLSFWVKSSVTGTFPLVVANNGNVRAFGATYTINAANTWEFKTVAITGDTTGTWLTTNGIGIQINWGLGGAGSARTVSTGWQNTSSPGSSVGVIAGTVTLVATTGATFYITGVQLEAGSVASPFERRDYGRELIMCQRYCVVDSYDALNEPVTSSAFWETSTSVSVIKVFPTKMRSAPSISVPTIGAIYALEPQVAWRQASALTVNEIGTVAAKVAFTVAANSTWGTFGRNSSVIGIRSSGTIIYSAEL